MALKLIRRFVMGAAVLVVLVTPSAVYTCGPFFETAVFVPGDGPQPSQADFAAGNLGVVLPTFRHSYLIVAYRYLNGLKLDKKQQEDAIAIWDRNVGPNPETPNEDEIGTWRLAREKVSGLPPEPKYATYAAVVADQPYQTFLNCPNEAYKTAASTLQDRLIRYGATSSAIRDWVTAQDQVFSNCDSQAQVIPAALDSGDALQRTDRAYQIAAAQFYARKFDYATASFDSLANDSSSPWSGISSYLAARALIRKANLAFPTNDKFDKPTMQAAQQRLEKILQNPKAVSIREPARRLLDYIRFRTEPETRAAELEKLMLKPDPGPNFRQHFWDYVLLVSNGKQGGDLSDWMHTFPADWQGPSGAYRRQDAREACDHAIAKWRESHSLAWLIAALELADANQPGMDDILRDANQVPAASPAYLSVRYFALRLMAERKQDDTVRAELDALLKRPADDLDPGTRNLLNDQRQKLTISLADFLAHAAELPAAVGFDSGDLNDDDSQEGKQSPRIAYFNAYSAQILARRLPLALLVESSQSAVLPSHLRREIARSAWVRAVVAGNFALADKLQPVLQELDNPLWQSMTPFRDAGSAAEKRFAAEFVILQNPGLNPSVREGLLRKATLGEIDNYRDNWWCDDLGAGIGDTGKDRNPQFPFPGFVPDSDRTQVKLEFEKLTSVGFAPNFLTSEVLAFAKDHPDNPAIPQALHLAVRATRYGCSNPETTHLSEAAFNLLHRKYPNSEWTEKTKYHY